MLTKNLNLMLWKWNENWNGTGTELEHEQLVKGVNKCKLGKKILLVERLIGTEKRREIYIISKYMIFGK